MSKTEEPSRTPTLTDFASRSVGATPPPIPIMTGEEELRAKDTDTVDDAPSGNFLCDPD